MGAKGGDGVGAILRHVVATPLLRNLTLLCLATAIAFPLYYFFSIRPAAAGLVLRAAAEEALFATGHCRREILGGAAFVNEGDLSPGARDDLREFTSDFQIMALRIVTAGGGVLYAAGEESGEGIGGDPDLYRSLSGGEAVTRFSRKQVPATGGEMVTREEVETFVPLMNGPVYLGALEVHYDVTGRMRDLRGFLDRSTAAVMAVMALILLGVASVIVLAARASIERARAGEGLEARVRERTEELAWANKELTAMIEEGQRMEDALRKASSDWRATFDSTSDLMAMIDERCRIVKANRAVSCYFDLSYREIVGRDCHDIFGVFGPPGRLHPLERMRENRRHEEAEVHLPERGAWYLVSADPVFDAEGALQGAVFTAKEITAHKVAEREKDRLQEELLQVQKMDSIGRLAGGIAHDFNNILSAILGYGEISLLELPEEHAARSAVNVIIESAQRAAALTGQLLAFSRKQILDMKVLDLNEVVSAMARMLSRLIREDITLTIRKEAPVRHILADRGQVEQVLLNLVVNARDAIAGSGEIVVETADADPDAAAHVPALRTLSGPWVMLSVRDTGAGMTEEVREKLFEPFFTTKESGKGTGLGLATVYGIVTQHGGHVEVESVPGKGSTFRVFLPAAGEREEKEPLSTAAAPLRGTERILIVDDDVRLRESVVLTLGKFGYETLDAGDGAEALRIAGEREIDLLITDLVMPGMSGRDLVEAFRKAREGVKVMAMSGHVDDAEEYRVYLSSSGIPLVRKPFAPKDLLERIRELLDGGGGGA